MLLLMAAVLAGCHSSADEHTADPRRRQALQQLAPLHRKAMAVADTLNQLQQLVTAKKASQTLGPDRWAWVQQDSAASAIRLLWKKSLQKLTPPVTQLYLMADQHQQLLSSGPHTPEEMEALLQVHKVVIARLAQMIPTQQQRLAQWRQAYLAYMQSCATGACYILPPE